ncbi:MAG: hypothetical protein Q9176_000036 [Flavoplaca citrina]
MPAQQHGPIPEAFKNVPLASPPPGVVQNLENPQSRSYQLYIISAVFIALSISFMIVRVYAKVAIQRSRTWDDSTVFKHHGGFVGSFFGSLSARLRSLTSRRILSEKSTSNELSPASSLEGRRPKRPRSQTYAELRVGPGGRGIVMPAPVV